MRRVRFYGIYQRSGGPDWNVYALVGTVELARAMDNPALPDWLPANYLRALEQLARRGTEEIWVSDDRVLLQSALTVVALQCGTVPVVPGVSRVP